MTLTLTFVICITNVAITINAVSEATFVTVRRAFVSHAEVYPILLCLSSFSTRKWCPGEDSNLNLSKSTLSYLNNTQGGHAVVSAYLEDQFE